MNVPTQFCYSKPIPKMSRQELLMILENIIKRWAEPPYCILLNSQLIDGDITSLQPGSNVLIINLPYYLDCPSSTSLNDLLKQLEFRFPYLDFCIVDGQYIIADSKFPTDTVLPSITD